MRPANRLERGRAAAAAAALVWGLVVGSETIAPAAAPDAATARPSGRTAAMLLERLESSRGLGVVLGSDDDLAVELARATEMLWHVRDPRAANVAALRERAEKAGLGIQRLAVERGRLERLPYADNTIDVVIARHAASDRPASWTMTEVMRVLRPEGIAIFSGGKGDALTGQVRSARGDAVEKWTDSAGQWIQFRKPARTGVDAWSHWQHGPDNNPVSSDSVIRAPYLTQFMAGPLYIGMPSITTAAGGRTFLAIGHISHHRREWGMLNKLVARNGYNGQILWERALPDGYLVHRSAFVATPEDFFLIDGSGCLVLDPVTGEQKERIRIPGVKGQWKWMAIRDGVLYALAGPKDPGVRTMNGDRSFGGWSWADLSPAYYAPRVPCGFGRTLAAYDLKTEKVLWTHRERADVDSRAMAILDDKMFLYCPDRRIRRLSLKTGEAIWTNEDAKVRELIEQPGRGLVSTPGFRTEPLAVATPKALILQGQTRMNVVAVSAEDGRLLWTKKKVTNNPNAIYVDGKVILGVGPGGDHVALDPESGRELENLHFRKVSCTRLTATPDSFFCRGEGTLRFDRASKQVLIDGAIRPACNDGALPANGLLYLGPWQCDCNLSLIGCIAKCSADDARLKERASGSSPLEKGDGSLEQVAPLTISPEDWATDRGDVRRSAASPVRAAPGRELWGYSPGRPMAPTAPVAAGGLVFYGSDDGKVRALSASDGQLRWEYATSAPIKSPPTIWEDRIFFGAGDGWAYSLEAATGRLLWRFRAAPVERYIMVYGSLCSTWPVHTGVLVDDGVAYLAAGIIDSDGTYVYALDAKTGEVLWRNDSCGHLDPSLRKGVSAQGNLTLLGDQLLLAGGNQVSPARFNRKTGECLAGPLRLGRPAANGGKFVGVFQDTVIAGGRVLYSAPENVATKGGFVALTKNRAYSLNMGGVPPAWDDDVFAVVNFRDGRLACYDVDKVAARIEQGLERPRPGQNRWLNNLIGALEADDAFRWRTDLGQPQSFEAESLAVCPNAVVAVARLQTLIRSQPQWFVAALDPESGQPLFRQELPGAPLPGGLLIDRDGRIVLTMLDGQVLCYGRRP